MPMRGRVPYNGGKSVGMSVERLADGLFYDFSTSAFVATPATPIQAVPEGVLPWLGVYMATLVLTPVAQFPDGGYCMYFHLMAEPDKQVIGTWFTAMHGGDDAPYFPVGTPTSFEITSTVTPTV